MPQMTNESTPISLRLNEELIEVLKKEARKIAYEQERDVSYVDLIRDAVAKYVNGVEPTRKTSEVAQTIEVSTGSKFRPTALPFAEPKTSEAIIAALEAIPYDEWLAMFGLDFNNPIAVALKELIDPIVETQSIARVVLQKDELPVGAIPKYKRDVVQIISLVPRRGAVPERISEGDSFVPTTFEIACHPSIKIEEILAKRAGLVVRAAEAGGYAIAKEEESNLYHLLKDAAESQTICVVEELTLDHLHEGYNAILKYGYQPANLILEPTTFLSLAKQAEGRKGNWEFVIKPDNKMNAGHYYGATIRLSERFERDDAFFTAPPKVTGNYVEKQPVKVLMHQDFPKLRVGFIAWLDIALFAGSGTVSRVFRSDERQVVNMGAPPPVPTTTPTPSRPGKGRVRRIDR